MILSEIGEAWWRPAARSARTIRRLLLLISSRLQGSQAGFDRQRPERETCTTDTTGETLRGLPISPGVAVGPIRLVGSATDAATVMGGDILVVPVIDPGLAPLFGLTAGLIAEMGGTLSHGAIIAREYGLPAVTNVRHVTRRLRDGERVALDAARGEARLLSPSQIS